MNQVIAAFDFDHTITNRDSLLPFLFYVLGKWKTTCHLGALLPDFLKYLLGNLSRQAIKEKILSQFIGGKSFSEILKFGQDYAEHQLDQYIRLDALNRIAWHQSQNHRCLLVSASLDFYLKPWAIRHGFETVLCSSLEVNPTGQITGCLKGLNCWGPEKVKRLLAYLGPKENYQLYAYGDSRGDEEMLSLADYQFFKSFS